LKEDGDQTWRKLGIKGIIYRASQASGLPVSLITGTRQTKDVAHVRRAIIIKAREAGITWQVIGDALNRHHATCYRIARNLGWHERINNIHICPCCGQKIGDE